MAKIRPQTVIAGVFPEGISAREMGLSAVQIVPAGGMSWSKTPVFLRTMPNTAASPTKAQKVARAVPGILAEDFTGEGIKGGLPAFANYLKEFYEGEHHTSLYGEITDTDGNIKWRMDEADYPSKQPTGKASQYLKELQGEGILVGETAV